MPHIEKNTFDWILIAKGIGIFFVVMGHFNPESSPTYWTNTRSVIYSFHMPLFFLLSGYLYTHKKYTYSQLLKNKIQRLIYPFMSIAVIFFVIKFIAGRVASLGHPVNIKSIYYLLTNPVHSYMPLLWFVYTLFIIFVTYPLLRKMLPNTVIIFTLSTVIIMTSTDIPIIGKAIFNMPFFAMGIHFRENNRANNIVLNSGIMGVLIPTSIFITFYILREQYGLYFIPEYSYAFILGTAGAIIVINIAKSISSSKEQKLASILAKLGFYSMTIYLFHTLFESTVRVIFMQKISFVSIPFEVTAATAIFAGVIFPLEFEKKVLRKYAITRKYILGLKQG